MSENISRRPTDVPVIPSRTDRRVLPSVVSTPARSAVRAFVPDSFREDIRVGPTRRSIYMEDTERTRGLYIDLLGQIRARGGRAYDGTRISESDIAAYAEVGVTELRNFKLGLGNISVAALLSGLEYFLPEIKDTDSRFIELRRIATRRSEHEKWIWLLLRGNNRISTNQAVRLLRLSQGESQPVFGGKVDIHPDNLSEMEKGVTNPNDKAINKIVRGIHLEEGERELAQLLRLLVNNITPISIGDIGHTSYGKLIRYFRVQQGYSVDDIAQQVGKSGSWLRNVEEDKPIADKEESIKRIFDVIGVPDDFKIFIDQRLRDMMPDITFNLQRSLLDTFFFIDYYLNLRQPFSIEDQELDYELKQISDCGKALAFVRNRADVPQGHLRQQAHVSKVEMGRKIPQDYIIVQMMRDLGFGPLDLSTRRVLSKAAKKRALRRPKQHSILAFEE